MKLILLLINILIMNFQDSLIGKFKVYRKYSKCFQFCFFPFFFKKTNLKFIPSSLKYYIFCWNEILLKADFISFFVFFISLQYFGHVMVLAVAPCFWKIKMIELLQVTENFPVCPVSFLIITNLILKKLISAFFSLSSLFPRTNQKYRVICS